MLVPFAALVAFIVEDTLVRAQESPFHCGDSGAVSRGEWQAREAVRSRRLSLPVSHVIVLHTVTQRCERKAQCARIMRAIQEIHLDERGWWDIAYNFLIGGDGRVYEGRGWNHTGSHSINYNFNSIGVAFVGNFEKLTPSKKMLDALRRLIDCGEEKGYLTPTFQINGHRDVSCTLSPGKYLYNIIREWEEYKGGRLKDFHCNPLNLPTVNEEILDYD